MKETTPGLPTRMRDVPCLILAGGLGTRLRSVLKDMPKPMAPIAGRPFLEYLVRWVRQAGFVNLILCVSYGAENIRDYFKDGASLDMRISYSLEPQPLGTWGAIRLAAESLPADDFLVLNGDSWLQVDLAQLLELHRRMRGVATVAAVEIADGGSRFGSLQLDEAGRVVEFAEKPEQNSSLVNGGVYMFSKKALAVAPANASSLEREVFPALISHGLYALRVRGYFIDIGVPEEYKRLQEDAKSWIQTLARAGARTC